MVMRIVGGGYKKEEKVVVMMMLVLGGQKKEEKVGKVGNCVVTGGQDWPGWDRNGQRHKLQ